jgi:hypothetical protein
MRLIGGFIPNLGPVWVQQRRNKLTTDNEVTQVIVQGNHIATISQPSDLSLLLTDACLFPSIRIFSNEASKGPTVVERGVEHTI